MRKILPVLVCILMFTMSLSAQDIIVTHDARKIEAKIKEVSNLEIKYKEPGNWDGPTFTIRVDEVDSIIYANGRVVMYNDTSELASKIAAKTAPKGNSWNLSGRSIRGTLPIPANTYNQEGYVTIEIRVNAAGDVISATLICSNIFNNKTQQLALDAAKKAKFTEGDHEQTGTITYNFIFN